jgi:hypothetical protein
MKSVFAILLLLGTASSQASAPPASSPAPQSAPSSVASPASSPKTIEDEGSRKARALIDKAIDALGGQAYATYTTRSEEGRTYSLYHSQTRGPGVLYRRFYRYADKDRLEVALERGIGVYDLIPFPLPVPEGKSNKKTDVAVVHNGDKGYQISYKGTEPEEAKDTDDYVRRRARSLEWVLRKWIHEPGVAFFFDGSALAANTMADQVTIMNARNESVTIFLDSTTHLPIKKTFSWRDRTDKGQNVEEEVFDNYKPVQGIMTPYTLSRYYNGDLVSQRFLSKVTYNNELAESLFEPGAGMPTTTKVRQK